MNDPISNLGDKDKEIAQKIFKIMGGDKNPSEDEMKYLINHASSMVSILQKSINHRLITLGVSAEESQAMIEVLSQMSHIAGGIAFADFSVTEKLAENAKEQ